MSSGVRFAAARLTWTTLDIDVLMHYLACCPGVEDYEGGELMALFGGELRAFERRPVGTAVVHRSSVAHAVTPVRAPTNLKKKSLSRIALMGIYLYRSGDKRRSLRNDYVFRLQVQTGRPMGTV